MFNLPDLSGHLVHLLDILERQVEALEGIDKSLDHLSGLLQQQHDDQ